MLEGCLNARVTLPSACRNETTDSSSSTRILQPGGITTSLTRAAELADLDVELIE